MIGRNRRPPERAGGLIGVSDWQRPTIRWGFG
ncbi:MAG: hypothetical protein QOE97_1916, partial [Pseudonocardiales bacterium]|nr:hypothetical protein [Pseudonocardiales bacterium]